MQHVIWAAAAEGEEEEEEEEEEQKRVCWVFFLLYLFRLVSFGFLWGSEYHRCGQEESSKRDSLFACSSVIRSVSHCCLLSLPFVAMPID
jgi:hypothetical protein